MNRAGLTKFSKAYKDELWNNFYKCFPVTTSISKALADVPSDILSSLVGLIGEEQAEEWMLCECEELDNIKPIELLKTAEGIKALKMYILSMPN